MAGMMTRAAHYYALYRRAAEATTVRALARDANRLGHTIRFDPSKPHDSPNVVH